MSLLEDRIRKIKTLAGQHQTGEEIAAQLGLSPETIKNYASREHIPVIFGKNNQELLPKVWKIQEALARNPHPTLEELCQDTTLTVEEVKEVSRRYLVLPFPSTIRAELRRQPKIDVLIEQGLDLREIAQRVGRTHQRISQYIEETGQGNFWRECRQKVLPLTAREQRQILSGLELLIGQLAEKAGWESQKAVEYLRKVPSTTYSFGDLVYLFEAYRMAQEVGLKLSLHDLEVEGMTYAGIGRILRTVGLKAMHGKNDRRIQEDFQLKRERIQACSDLPLSGADIRYFSGVRHDVSVYQYWAVKGKRKGIKKLTRTSRKHFKSRKEFTYRLASQIYECIDAGLTLEETKEYCHTAEQIIMYAQEHRKEIQPIIVEALRRLYQENIITPYRSKYGLEHLLQQGWKNQAIARTYQHTNWNATIVAYFLDLTPSYVLQQFWKRGGGSRKRILEERSMQLAAHTASEIYQLQDQGKSPQQICQTLHLRRLVVEHAFQHRNRYAPMIVEGLQVLFPNENITKPYR